MEGDPPGSVDSDGGHRCWRHPEARDRLSVAEFNLVLVEGRMADLTRDLEGRAEQRRKLLTKVEGLRAEYAAVKVRPPSAWCLDPDVMVKVVDPDGWRDHSPLGPKPFDEPITLDEFRQRLMYCTLLPLSKDTGP